MRVKKGRYIVVSLCCLKICICPPSGMRYLDKCCGGDKKEAAVVVLMTVVVNSYIAVVLIILILFLYL
jgi:hypothetical protein